MKRQQGALRGVMAALLVSLAACLPLGAHADTKVRASSFEYDASGLLIKEVVEPDSPNDCLQTSYGYDAYGNKISVSTSACAGATGYTVSSAAAARTATSSYGADGRFPVSTTNALSQSETKVYDARFGAITSLTGPNGLTTTWQYDGFGRKTRETRADGTYTTWSYLLCTDVGANCPGPIAGAASVWVAVEQSYAANAVAMAAEKRQFHDMLGRAVRVQTQGFDGAGAGPTLVQDTEYDALGRVARKSHLYALTGGNPQWSSYTYDVLGRVVQENSPDPDASGGVGVTTMAYNGLTTTVTNSKGQTKTTNKNAQGQVAQITDHQGNTVVYSYDALGQLLQTNAGGSITTLTYNQRGQKIAMVDPAMGAWEYRYNAFGELVWQRDSLGKTQTIAYDILGRMTQRTEPDLVSQWSYDKKFDATACGKGIGKLCEAKADNGYKRVHTYDTLGRPSSTATVLDNPAQPATVSVAYEANTGRVISKTWPTGYQASYQYSASGYLKKVTGGGTAGFAQTVTFEVTAMDAKGHITQYKQGSQVTTVRNYDDATGRLKSQTATRNGFAAGGVMANTYTHDSLGNMLTRADNAPGVGTQESFTYDALNRLTLYTILGGGVSPTQSTEVMYDARGNITYKSDVGRYWYDAQRPNRLTNVTLETAPGAQVARTGTRQLSYAFDDYRTGAQSVGGTTLGNGNLEYTVSYDQVNARHTYRSESYTSFNMPREISFGNFINDATACQPGYTLSGGNCLQSASTTNPALVSYACAAGYTLSGSSCVKTSTSAATPVYTCPAGYTLSGQTCSQTIATAANQTFYCPDSNFPNLNGSICWWSGAAWYGYDETQPRAPASIAYSCPAGQTLSGSSCLATSTVAAILAGYTCPAGHTLSGSDCIAPNVAAAISYSCPSGQTLSGSSCIQSATLGTASGSSSAADRTLSFVYGPEHQRIKQNVTLSGSGTTSYSAGTTWYLNGEDSQGLSFEKEIKDSGVTEHKHYVSAGGTTFALFTSRTGTQTTTTTRYLHHDHLGSLAAITDESGQVVERLAYDPWGKRRNVNGTQDVLDSIVGLNTDRGYTMHEHLDEMGIIHMNGRVYDPLIGRFMSADPFVQAPDNLQSYNRYSYVLNNPLAYTDPSGYWSLKKHLKAAFKFLSSPTPRNLFNYVASHPGQKQVDRYIMTHQWAYTVGQTVVTALTAVCGGCGGAAWSSYYAYQSTGSMSAAFRAGAISAASAALFYGAGEVGAGTDVGSFAHYAAHAGAGCLSSAMGGGECGSGALSGVAGLFATQSSAGWSNAGQLAAAMVAGGIGAELGGGKFANGAATGAFGYLFNYCMHSTTGCWVQKGMNASKIAGGSAGFAVGMATCGVTFGLGCAAAVESGNQVIEGATYFANAGAEEGFKPSKSILQSVFGESTGSHINTGLEVGTALQNAGAPVALKGFSLFRPDMSTRIQQMGTLQLGVTAGSTAGKLLSDPYYRDQIK